MAFRLTKPRRFCHRIPVTRIRQSDGNKPPLKTQANRGPAPTHDQDTPNRGILITGSACNLCDKDDAKPTFESPRQIFCHSYHSESEKITDVAPQERHLGEEFGRLKSYPRNIGSDQPHSTHKVNRNGEHFPYRSFFAIRSAVESCKALDSTRLLRAQNAHQTVHATTKTNGIKPAAAHSLMADQQMSLKEKRPPELAGVFLISQKARLTRHLQTRVSPALPW
ncbi:hypothetical protein SAMN04515647_4070 [Cohaesibacter sp. ES.047]|nr:hypothetical protein SAMN04515647_4070 [Cohaesibacter sp. ES.047]